MIWSVTAVARAFRYLYRFPWLALHLVLGLPVTLLLMAGPWRHWRCGGQALEAAAVRWWSAGLLKVFGLRVRRVGTPLTGGVLMVANHVSWVDIEMIHSQALVGFVAKAEIARWPLVGWMARRGHTLFHQRGSNESLGGVMEEMVRRLRQDRPVAVFPEGRTRDGTAVGPFHARIFSVAVDASVPVQPVAVRYGRQSADQTRVAFGARESFVANFLRLLGDAPCDAEVHFMPPIDTGAVEGRRQIAELARSRVVAALQGP